MSDKKTFSITISRVDGPVFSGEVQSVTVPGVEGEMTILPNHTALISPLRAGKIELVKISGEKETFEVQSGTLEVSANVALILL